MARMNYYGKSFSRIKKNHRIQSKIIPMLLEPDALGFIDSGL